MIVTGVVSKAPRETIGESGLADLQALARSRMFAVPAICPTRTAMVLRERIRPAAAGRFRDRFRRCFSANSLDRHRIIADAGVRLESGMMEGDGVDKA